VFIETHVVCWNEHEMLPFFLRHYLPLSDKLVVHDNHSTDDTRELADKAGAEVRLFGCPGAYSEEDNVGVKNRCWKGSKADWIIIVDTDEFLKVTREELEASSCTLFRTRGYDMVSEHMPETSVWEISTGTENLKYAKPCIFDPKAFTDVQYAYGAHYASFKGKAVYGPRELALCHYKWIGGGARVHSRHQVMAARMAPVNQERRWSVHWRRTLDFDLFEFTSKLGCSAPLWTA
jgi:glycosyltransferase involved in cell wall biosynthesis